MTPTEYNELQLVKQEAMDWEKLAGLLDQLVYIYRSGRNGAPKELLDQILAVRARLEVRR